MRRISRILAFCTVLFAAPWAMAAGTTPLAMAQQIDVNGQPLANCQVNFYQAGTPNTKQAVFFDFGLSQQLPNPLSCDQAGRVPMHWLADGLIHVQLTDASGLPIIDTTMQVLGPSSGGGGGGGGTVDPTTILATGDLKVKYGTGSLTGFVRANGLTIGNATSGGTERANADTQNLFVYLYGADPNLAVSGGRTGNALNDFNANKQLSLPDWRGYALAALGDMGNSATSVLTNTFANCLSGATPTTLGAACGQQSWLLNALQIPTINSNGNFTSNQTNLINANLLPHSFSAPSTGGSQVWVAWGATDFIAFTSATGPVSVSSNNTGGQPHPTVTPEKLATFYLKL